MPKAFLVLNPVTGFIPPIIRRRKFENHFKNLGWEFDVYITTGEEDLTQIVKTEIDKGVDLIVAAGGDGTISGVASGMVFSKIPLGIIPVGTANLFAHDIGIPVDMDRALKLLTGPHQLLDLDLMQSGNRAFVMNLSVGLSARTILHTEREQKKRFGILAYAWNMTANLIGVRLETFNLKVDGVHHKVRASEIMVVNSSLIGIRTLHQNINIIPDDGQVEICIARARTLFDWLTVVGNILIGHSERNTRFRCLNASQSIVVNSKRTMFVQGDGELLGKTPVEIKVLPGALRVIIPEAGEPFFNLPNPFNIIQNPIIQKTNFKTTPPDAETIKRNG